MNLTKSAVRQSAVRVARLNNRRKKVVPFSAVGIVAILFCPVVFFLDVFSEPQVSIGVFYLVMLALLSNQKDVLLLLFTTLSSVFLLIDIRLIYGLPGAELPVMEKIIALPILWMVTLGIIQMRRKVKNTKASGNVLIRLPRSRKPVCSIKVQPEIADRIPASEETKAVFKHLQTSKVIVDPYTMDLIRFIYARSKKN